MKPDPSAVSSPSAVAPLSAARLAEIRAGYKKRGYIRLLDARDLLAELDRLEAQATPAPALAQPGGEADISARIAVKQREIEATGLAQWAYHTPDSIDAARYRRLRVLGVPRTTPESSLLCFTNLDAFVDADMERQRAPESSATPAPDRERLAAWMIANGIATGHGDTVADLVTALESHTPAPGPTRALRNFLEAEEPASVTVPRHAGADYCEGFEAGFKAAKRAALRLYDAAQPLQEKP